MSEFDDGNNPLTLTELAYEVTNDIHKVLQQEEKEAKAIQQQLQEDPDKNVFAVSLCQKQAQTYSINDFSCFVTSPFEI